MGGRAKGMLHRGRKVLNIGGGGGGKVQNIGGGGGKEGGGANFLLPVN